MVRTDLRRSRQVKAVWAISPAGLFFCVEKERERDEEIERKERGTWRERQKKKG